MTKKEKKEYKKFKKEFDEGIFMAMVNEEEPLSEVEIKLMKHVRKRLKQLLSLYGE